jgi:hypothetical protein
MVGWLDEGQFVVSWLLEGWFFVDCLLEGFKTSVSWYNSLLLYHGIGWQHAHLSSREKLEKKKIE